MRSFAVRAAISLAVGVLLVLTSGAERLFVRGRRAHPNPAFASIAPEIPLVINESPYAAARQMLAMGQSSEAEQIFAKLAADQPILAPYMALPISDARLSRGDTAGALQALAGAAAIRNRAVGPRALERTAEILRDSGSLEAAIAAYRELAEIRSGDEKRKTLIDLARCEKSLDRSDDALKTLHAVLAMRGSPQVASSAVDEIVGIAAPDRAVAPRLAAIYYDAGEYAKAAALFELVGPTSTAMIMKLARSHERADQFREAIRDYKRVLGAKPGRSDLIARYRIGLCYQRIGNDREGEKFFQQVLQISPRGSFADDILYRLASIRDQKDKREEALAYYGRLLVQFPRSMWADEAAWKIGLAYLEDSRPQEAADAFEHALKRYPRSDYASAMGYWRARVLERSGRTEDALEQYRSVLRASQDVYYRARAAAAYERMGGKFSQEDLDAALNKASGGEIAEALADLRAIRDAAAPDVAAKARSAAKDLLAQVGLWKDLSRLSTDPLDTAALLVDVPGRHEDAAREINALLKVGAYDPAAAEILALKIDAGRRPEQQLAMIRILAEGGAYRRAMREAESLLRSMGGPLDPVAMPDAAAQLLFPRYYASIAKTEAQKYGLDYRLVLAVIREESRFQPDIASWAGAQGLMQIMPATGQRIARSLPIENYRREMLLDPRWNISMGTYYLSALLADYSGKDFLALAGYNAGPGNTGRWIRENADAEADFFVEKISFRETRNYVKRVLATYWTYRQLDGEPLEAL